MAFGWCVAGAGACGLERGRFVDSRRYVRREMCRRVSRRNAFTWCRARAGACGLELGRVGAACMCVRQEICFRMRRGRRSGGAWQAWTLADWRVAGLGQRVCLSCGKCVARDETGRRCTQHDIGRRINRCATYEYCRCRSEADSSDGMRRRLPVTKKPVPVACGVLRAFNSRDAARHKTRMNRPANMSPHVVATHFRTAHDTFLTRAKAPRPHVIASPTALPGAACPRSARPAHAFVVLRNSPPRVTPRHVL